MSGGQHRPAANITDSTETVNMHCAKRYPVPSGDLSREEIWWLSASG